MIFCTTPLHPACMLCGCRLTRPSGGKKGRLLPHPPIPSCQSRWRQVRPQAAGPIHWITACTQATLQVSNSQWEIRPRYGMIILKLVFRLKLPNKQCKIAGPVLLLVLWAVSCPTSSEILQGNYRVWCPTSILSPELSIETTTNHLSHSFLICSYSSYNLYSQLSHKSCFWDSLCGLNRQPLGSQQRPIIQYWSRPDGNNTYLLVT